MLSDQGSQEVDARLVVKEEAVEGEPPVSKIPGLPIAPRRLAPIETEKLDLAHAGYDPSIVDDVLKNPPDEARYKKTRDATLKRISLDQNQFKWMTQIKHMLDLHDDLKWFGHASFLLYDDKKGRRVLYIDPFDFKARPKEQADVIFITHAHFDHWSTKDLQQVLTRDTVVVLVNGCEGVRLDPNKTIKTEPNKTLDIGGLKVETVPAYNIKPERLQFHPRENRWVGYVFNVNGSRLYHAGDTDFIPEMRTLKDIDVALLPIGGTYTMDVNEAIEAANAIGAKVTVPIHYKRLLGAKARDAEQKLTEGVKGKVEILREVA